MKLKTTDGQVFDVMYFDKIRIRRQGKMVDPKKEFVELEAKDHEELREYYADVLHGKRDDFHVDAEIKYYAWLLIKVAVKAGREIHDEELDWAIEHIADYAAEKTTIPVDEEIIERFYAQLSKKINDLSFNTVAVKGLRGDL